MVNLYAKERLPFRAENEHVTINGFVACNSSADTAPGTVLAAHYIRQGLTGLFMGSGCYIPNCSHAKPCLT